MIRYFLFLIILLSNCKSDNYGYRFILTIKTTSDWTEVDFSKNNLICLKYTLKNSQEIDFKYRPFKISKNAYDSTKVAVEYIVFLPKAKFGNDTITIKKGDIGYTKVEITNTKSQNRLFWLNEKNISGDPTNKMQFVVSYKDFERVGIPLEKFERSAVDKLVFSFYYPWYYPQKWFINENRKTRNTPTLGFYDSGDSSVIKSHIKLAKEANIDCFIISWFGIDTRTDRGARILVPYLEREKMKFVIYLEKCTSQVHFSEINEYLKKDFFASPSYLFEEDKPVLFMYKRISKKLRNKLIPLSADSLFLINIGTSYNGLQHNDGLHIYRPAISIKNLISINQILSALANYHNKIFIASVCPGYDDRLIRSPGKFVDRRDGEFYRKTWEAALASNPDWIAIISFNEWLEGTEIEPSKELGDKYLKITKEYVDKFKAMRR